MVLNAGFWAGMTLYPESKCTAARAGDMIELYGRERLWMNSACDWGVSVPLAVPRAALEMRRRGHAAKKVDELIYQNPMRFLSQSAKFNLPA
jgi:predicted metal-dependent TIM-barrel fold hydrolase